MTLSGNTKAPSAIDQALDDYVAEAIAEDPILGTTLGVAHDVSALTDLSPAGFEQRAQRRAHYLARVRSLTPSSAADSVAQATFVERLEVAVESDQALLPQSEISVIASALHGVREVFDLMPTETSGDWEAFATRLLSVPATLKQLTDTWLWAHSRGAISASAQILKVAAQARGWSEDAVFSSLTAAAPADLKQGLLDVAAAEAHTALAEMAHFLERELAPLGAAKQAVGLERYRLASRHFLGAEIDLHETYAWAFDELASIQSEMAAVARTLTGSPDVDQARALLDADPARQIVGPAAFARWMQELADRAMHELDGVHFDIPAPVRTIECLIAPTHDGGIYYTGPSEDFSRPGRMWWSVPRDVNTFATWRETTTVFHEGVPGHHLQVGQAVSEAEHLNRWQRLMAWVSGHGEGWALYAERLMLELGYLQDPGDHLGMLEAQAFRAARVVVDIGMHLELLVPDDVPGGLGAGSRWTPELGRAFMRQHTSMPDSELEFEINRYLGWPGQAPSYKVGERLWLQARREAQDRLGSAFDLRAFHTKALKLGSMGLDPLSAALRRL